MEFSTKLDALTDDELWHIAAQVASMSGGSLFNVSQRECVTALRASFMDPDTGCEFIKSSAAA